MPAKQQRATKAGVIEASPNPGCCQWSRALATLKPDMPNLSRGHTNSSTATGCTSWFTRTARSTGDIATASRTSRACSQLRTPPRSLTKDTPWPYAFGYINQSYKTMRRHGFGGDLSPVKFHLRYAQRGSCVSTKSPADQWPGWLLPRWRLWPSAQRLDGPSVH